MSVNPGFGGQKYIPHSTDKIRMMKNMLGEKGLPALIEVDGGVSPENAGVVAAAGADILVMGSAFFHSKDYRAIVKRIREIT
jgi:ribulose-phosphate 3-epimerase